MSKPLHHDALDFSAANVLLVNPSINPKTQSPLLSSVIRTSFPINLGYLAGYLEGRNIAKCVIVDEQLDTLDEEHLRSILGQMPLPRIIGITVMTATCGPAYDLARLIRKIDPEAFIVAGGIHCTVVPAEPLETGAVDVVVRGEGEETLGELVQAIMAGQEWRETHGLTFKRDGRVVHTTDRALVKDLDALPPFPYHKFAHHKNRYSGFYSIQTSRGCPYKCTFCSQRSMTALSYRYISTERALGDIRVLVEDYGADVIRLIDDNIAVNKNRLRNLIDGIIERGYHKRVSFEAPMRADNINAEILDRLKAANFTLITYGLETASEKLMEEMKKGETVAEVVHGINLAAERGFIVGTTLIFGFPNETWKDRWDAIKLVFKLPLDSVRFNILTPYPGTPVYAELMERGEIHIKKDWENFSVQYMWAGNDLPYVPAGTNRYGLMFTTMAANLAYYLRPAGIRKLLTKRIAGGNVVVLPKGWIRTEYAWRMVRVGLYLMRRAAFVLLMLLLTAPAKWLGDKVRSLATAHSSPRIRE